MTLQQCRYLIGIAQCGSLSRAASMLYVTEPSLSNAVRLVEEELKITIFERTNRGVVLTKEGTELLLYAKMLVAEEKMVRYHFQRQTADVLKLSVSSQHLGCVVEAMAVTINALGGRNCELTLNEGKSTDVIEDVSSGRSTLGILSVSDLNFPVTERAWSSKWLTYTPLVSMQECVFLRRGHPLSERKAIALDELKVYPYLTYRCGDVPLNFAEEFINVDVAPRVVYLKDRGTMDSLLSHTDGYNLGTGLIVDGYMDADIIAVPLEVSCRIQVGFIKKEGLSLSHEAKEFLRCLISSLRKAAQKSRLSFVFNECVL